MRDNSYKEELPSINDGWLHKLSSRRSIFFLTTFSILFIILAVSGSVLYFSRKPSPQSDQSAPPSMEELAQQFPQISKILEDEKLASVYKQFMVAYQEGGPDAAMELAKNRGIINQDNEIRMTLELSTEDTESLEASLEEHGIKVTAVSGYFMDIAIPLDVLLESLESETPGSVFMEISGLDQIIRIRLPISANEDVGNVETEGAAVIGSPAWNAAGITGKGIKIGVLDVGFDHYKDLLGTDLPLNVSAQSFIYGMEVDQTGNPHGTAVSEIIHDIAPDAELYFAGYQTSVEKQSAVDWLMSQSVDIISSSTGTNFGRRDGLGPLAKMVEEVVAEDVLWVNSSGNTGTTHYRGEFTDRDHDGYHEFSADDEYMGFSPSGAAALALNWDDWDELQQDFDFFVLDSDGNEIASAKDVQNGPGSDAGEFLYYEFEDEGPYYLAIYAANSDRAVTFDFFLRDGLIEYFTPEYSVNTPGDSSAALTVGAVHWESGVLEDYSSRGPTDDGRIKPDVVAPSGVTSAVYGEPWDGTSASCPHVSGAAALVMQAFPEYTVQQVRDFLINHTMDINEPGPDSNTGYGVLVLGEVPDINPISAPPTPTEVSFVPAPTETIPSNPTETPLPTTTPILENKPTASSNQSGSAYLLLVLIGCVLLPGVIGFGGLVLLGVVIYNRRRSKTMTRDKDRMNSGLQVQPNEETPVYPQQVSPSLVIECPNCGKVNRPGTRYCTNCGAHLEPEPPSQQSEAPHQCTNCGAALRANVKFCPKCGTPVKAK